MQRKYINLHKLTLCGLTFQMSSDQKENLVLAQNNWSLFNKELRLCKKKDNIPGNWVKYGVIFKENNINYYMSAIENERLRFIPEIFSNYTIENSQFLSIYHSGPVSNLKLTVYHLFKNIIPQENIIIPNKGLIMLEKYDSRFNWNNMDSQIELLVPIIKQYKNNCNFYLS